MAKETDDFEPPTPADDEDDWAAAMAEQAMAEAAPAARAQPANIFPSFDDSDHKTSKMNELGSGKTTTTGKLAKYLVYAWPASRFPERALRHGQRHAEALRVIVGRALPTTPARPDDTASTRERE